MTILAFSSTTSDLYCIFVFLCPVILYDSANRMVDHLVFIFSVVQHNINIAQNYTFEMETHGTADAGIVLKKGLNLKYHLSTFSIDAV